MLLAGIAAFTSCDEGTRGLHGSGKAYYLGNAEKTDAALFRTIAALATVTALVYCHKRGREFTPANPDESYIGNILLMMGVANKQKIERCFERLWILNADHGMTNSTAAFLNAASTLTDPLSASISALASAYGPLHGAAVEIAYRDFEAVGTVENVPKLIADVKAKKFRLFGYGHRIYKVVDPRGKLVRTLIEEYKEDIESNPFLKVAMEIDRVAGSDEYFTSRNLHANADLYGCFLYTAL
jgi:citrate synthase